MEHKTFRAFDTKVLDEEQGIVESIVAVMGNIDDGGDVIHPSAFRKSIVERGLKIRVLDQHQTNSIMCVIGKPLEVRELSRGELPPELMMQYPDATGALWAKTQFLLSTPEGRGAFERLKTRAVDEWSIGYDSLDKDYSRVTRDGKDVTVRNLRTVKLYEYSPVIWGMNSATATLSAKSTEPTEGKPYQTIHEGDVWKVYKLDADGNPTGEPLGEHDNEADAQAQVRALYANEDGKSAKEMTPYGPRRRMGDALVGAMRYSCDSMTNDWLASGMITSDEHKLMRRAIDDSMDMMKAGLGEMAERPCDMNGMGMMAGGGPAEGKAGRVLSARNAERILGAMEMLKEALSEAGIEMPGQDDDTEDTAPDGADKQAGPGGTPPPTLLDERTRQLKLIETELHQIDLWR